MLPSPLGDGCSLVHVAFFALSKPGESHERLVTGPALIKKVAVAAGSGLIAQNPIHRLFSDPFGSRSLLGRVFV